MPILLHGEWKKRDLTQLHLWDGWFIVIKWFVTICVQVSCRWSIGGWLVISLVKLHYVQHKGGFGSRMSAWVFLWSKLVQSLMSVSFDVPEKTATFTLYCWWAAAFSPLCWPKFYLLEDEVNGAPGVDVHKVHFCVVIDELCAPRHSVREAAFDLQRQYGLQNGGLNQCV